MLTVGNDEAEVERRLAGGQLECPDCGGRLCRWGHARDREIRLGGETRQRRWLRRFAARAEALRPAFTVLACALDADPLLPGPSGSALADAVAAILAAAAAAARRWGAAFMVSPWELASAVTSGGLLSPGPAVQLINTSCPW